MAIYKFSNAGGFGAYTRYNDFLAGNPAVILDKGSMYPLGVFTLASAQASVTFSNIPQTYTHLQLRYIARDTFAATVDIANLTFNGATSGYSWHELLGNGTAASAFGFASQTSIRLGRVAYASATANTFAAGVLDVLDYANTNKNKTTRLLAGVDLNGSGTVLLDSGLYQSTTAISSVTITAAGTAFAANSSFALYGVL